MSNGKRGSPEARRRRPPTIDLKATEIASEPVKPAEPVDPPKESAAASGRCGRGPRGRACVGAAAIGAPASGAAASGAAAGRAQAGASRMVRTACPRLRETVNRHADWRLIGAGAIGAAAMMAVLLVILATGALSSRTRSTPLASRLTLLEQQTREVANRPQPTGLDPARARRARGAGRRRRAGDGAASPTSRAASRGPSRAPAAWLRSSARLARAEQAGAAPRPAPGRSGARRPRGGARSRAAAARRSRHAARRRQCGRARCQVARRCGVRGGAEGAACRARGRRARSSQALTARVAALEQAAKVAQERHRRHGRRRPGRAARFRGGLAARRGRARRSVRAGAGGGAPACRPIAKALAPLEPFAATGVPRAAALARELSGLTGAMLSAAGQRAARRRLHRPAAAECRAAGAHPSDQRGAGRRRRRP